MTSSDLDPQISEITPNIDPSIESAVQEVGEDLSCLEGWEARYRYIIELGDTPREDDNDLCRPENRVRGCVSQVWLKTKLLEPDHIDSPPRMRILADSDAVIVRGLIAIMINIFSDQPVDAIARADVLSILDKLGLDTHLTSQRTNGLMAFLHQLQRSAQNMSTDDNLNC